MVSGLKKGDTIGVFSPSRPITAEAPEAVKKAVRFLEKNGYYVKMGRLTGRSDWYRSGSVEERADELNELIHDDSVTCLMASMGGYVSGSLLPYIDYTYFREHPKLIVGHSDVTALLVGIYAQTNITTLYGTNLVTAFGRCEEYATESLHWLEKAGSRESFVYSMPPFYSDEAVDLEILPRHEKKLANAWKVVSKGKASGRLIGGNLNTLVTLFGSPYMPKIREGDILFFENVGEYADACERYMYQLKNCGVLDKISGLIIGKHREYKDMGTGRSETDICLEIMGERRLPILSEFDCGHMSPVLTLPIGRIAQLDTFVSYAQALKIT